jgi:hypothetical protein
MHAHRSAGSPAGVARPGTRAFEHQRRLALELAVDPPPAGESPEALAGALGLSVAELLTAAAGLALAGLAERVDGRLRAAPALQAIELLWPLG